MQYQVLLLLLLLGSLRNDKEVQMALALQVRFCSVNARLDQ